jgi:hypothetical protein
VVAALVIVVAAIASWWTLGRRAAEGTPRLRVDREVIDLGEVPFSVPARATFTLTNAGAGPLVILEPPRVKVLQGC